MSYSDFPGQLLVYLKKKMRPSKNDVNNEWHTR